MRIYVTARINSNSMQQKTLTIIFGTTRGLGAALYEHATQQVGDCVLVNRKSVESRRSGDAAVVVDLGQTVTDHDISKIFSAKDLSQYGAIQLIANASITGPITTIGNTTSQEIAATLLTNAVNYMSIINAFIAKTSSLDVHIRILVVSSGSAESPTHGLAPYCASKAAIEMFIRSVALEPHDNLEIVAFRPGVMDTDMQQALRNADQKDFANTDRYKQLYQDGQLRTSESVATTIFKLLDSSKQWTESVVDINTMHI